MPHADDVELLKKARQGDIASREELYLTYFPGNKQVRALLAREINNPVDRKDVLHDANLSMVRAAAEFRGDSKLQTFVYRVVQITILQKRRREVLDGARRFNQRLRSRGLWNDSHKSGYHSGGSSRQSERALWESNGRF
jgi:DNA-directed RNA polymerase specialized sigma24 family protein